MRSSPVPLFRFEVRFCAGRPNEGERYPLYLWFGINVEDYAMMTHRFLTLQLPFFELTVGKTIENYIVGGRSFWRLVLGRRIWSRTFGSNKTVDGVARV